MDINIDQLERKGETKSKIKIVPKGLCESGRSRARAQASEKKPHVLYGTNGMKSIHLGILRLNLFINMKIPHIPRPPMPSSAAFALNANTTNT